MGDIERHFEGTQGTATLARMAESNRPLLRAVFPELSAELAAGLRADGSPELAEQARELAIWDRCGCEDSFCTSFYVGPRPVGTWSDEGEHHSQGLDVERGMVVLDIVDGRIRYIEVIDRPEIRAALENAIRRVQ